VKLGRIVQPAAPAEPVLHDGKAPVQGFFLEVSRDSQILFGRVRHARDFFSRLRGLLLTEPMQAHEGLLLTPCRQVHTIGMAYPIDIVFLDETGSVLRCLSDVQPYRAVSTPAAFHTLELAAGQIKRLGLMPGQSLTWTPAKAHGGQQ